MHYNSRGPPDGKRALMCSDGHWYLATDDRAATDAADGNDEQDDVVV